MSVRTDVVNLSININGDDARNNLNKLQKSAADIKFEMQGLTKGTAEYVAKAAELGKIDAQMDSLKKQIGITSLTMKELGQERQKLTAILNAQVPDSGGFKAYEKQLQAVIARQNELKAGTKGITQSQEGLSHSNFNLGESFKHIALRVAEYLSVYEIYNKLKEFITGTIEEANNAEAAVANLTNSLQNAGRQDLFETFKKEAESFAQTYERLDPNKILNVFTKLVDYGKLTKNQITQLTDVIINYAAKQNISVEESTDVFTKALEGNARGLKTYGINIKDAGNFSERLSLITQQLAEKIKGAETALENTNKGVFEVFNEHLRRAKEAIGLLIEGFFNLTKSQHELAVSAKEQADQGAALVDQYEQLSKKTAKTAEEKNKLKVIESELVGIFGESILQINKQTGAYELNIEATKDLIKQKLLLANNDAASLAAKVAKAQEEQADATKKLQLYTDELTASEKQYGLTLAEAQKQYQIVYREPTEEEKNSPVHKLISLNEQLGLNRSKYREAGESLKDYEKQLDDLGFKLSDVDKLINPKLPTDIVGNGDPNSAEKKAAAKAAAAAAEKEAKARAAEYARLLKEAKAFYDQLQALKKRNEAGITPEEQEVAAVVQKYDDLIKKAKDFFAKKAIDKKTFNAEELIIQEAQQREINAIINKYNKIAFEEQSKTEYKDSLDARQQYTDQLKIQTAKDYADGKLTKAEYSLAIKRIELDEAKDRITIDTDYSDTVKEAAKNVYKSKAAYEKLTTDELIKQIEARIELSKEETARRLQKDIDIARPDSKKQFDARRAQLKNEQALEIQAAKDKYAALGITLADNNEILLGINAAYHKKNEELDKEAALKKIQQIDQYVGYAIQAYSSIAEIVNNKENAAFNKEKALNDKKRIEFKKQLDGKLLSQAQYDKKLAALQNEQDEKEKILKRKQAQRAKTINLFSAIQSGARSVLETFVNNGGFPSGILPAAIMAGLAAIQIGAIASAPLPELGKGDWFTTGDKHSDPSGGIPVMIERDEAVISAAAMTDKNKYTISGTPAQITSRLNSQAGGANWAGGAVVSMAKWISAPAPRISSSIPAIMASGGVVRSINQSNDDPMAEVKDLLRILISGMAENTTAVKEQPDKVQAVVSIKEFRRESDKYDAAKKASAINQKS
jgi:hypothetical protein